MGIINIAKRSNRKRNKIVKANGDIVVKSNYFKLIEFNEPKVANYLITN